MSDYQHTIQAVARRTGLSPHVIRIWEKRYGVVAPERTGTNRRLYSDEQIARLTLLREITHAGQGISSIATLPIERLQQIAAASVPTPSSADLTARPESGPTAFLTTCLKAVRALDAPALEAALRQAELVLGNQGMLQRVAAPLAQSIGTLWREGSITAAHEHFASAVLRHWLTQTAKSYAASPEAPVLIVATPSGQLHELGALLVSAAAANLGWRVVYLGASLPAAEIAGAALQQRARAVALSLVYPEDDPSLESELIRLRELLPESVSLIVGGRAAPNHRASLDRIRAIPTEDLVQFGNILDSLRAGPITPK